MYFKFKFDELLLHLKNMAFFPFTSLKTNQYSYFYCASKFEIIH